ncbi:hypothetical protein EJ08DRAFT_694001 [Tothia fuscella]|uniref:Uncharacterized protein n=1 Tax=Tothia fuscella TaxID=1048955 RepID=A0A9P4U0U6_9PEZI|nr:hypothetical protein EJ08DRAFT_694001 [Tothia fuscella]
MLSTKMYSVLLTIVAYFFATAISYHFKVQNWCSFDIHARQSIGDNGVDDYFWTCIPSGEHYTATQEPVAAYPHSLGVAIKVARVPDPTFPPQNEFILEGSVNRLGDAPWNYYDMSAKTGDPFQGCDESAGNKCEPFGEDSWMELSGPPECGDVTVYLC